MHMHHDGEAGAAGHFRRKLLFFFFITFLFFSSLSLVISEVPNAGRIHPMARTDDAPCTSNGESGVGGNDRQRRENLINAS